MPSPTAEMFERLVRLETKLDMFLERLGEERVRTDDQEARLRRVERWTYALPPTALLAAVAFVAEVVART